MGSIKNLKENKTLFMVCDCLSEILMIEYDHELQMAELAIYEHYSTYIQKMSLWKRIKYCWQIMIHKKPYGDQFILNHNNLQELKQFLHMLDI